MCLITTFSIVLFLIARRHSENAPLQMLRIERTTSMIERVPLTLQSYTGLCRDRYSHKGDICDNSLHVIFVHQLSYSYSSHERSKKRDKKKTKEVNLLEKKLETRPHPWSPIPLRPLLGTSNLPHKYISTQLKRCGNPLQHNSFQARIINIITTGHCLTVRSLWSIMISTWRWKTADRVLRNSVTLVTHSIRDHQFTWIKDKKSQFVFFLGVSKILD